MKEIVKKQILDIRATGETNMFDIPAVIEIAKRECYVELLDYLEKYKGEYANFILTGELGN